MRDYKEYEDRFSEIFKEAVDNSEEIPNFYSEMTMNKFGSFEQFEDKMEQKSYFLNCS